jgi:hypothetical protein
MSGDPVEISRLVEGSDTHGAEILRAWATRQPSDAARANTLAAIGLSGLALGSAGAAAAGGSASIAPKAALASWSLLKWIAIGAAVTVGVGGAAYVRETATPSTTPASVPAASTALARETSSPASVASTPSWTVVPATPPAHTSDPAPVHGSSASAPREPPARATAPSSASSSLDEEVRAIDQARSSLAAGDADRALALVDAHDARYAGGALAEESADVRIEALYQSGRRKEAHALAIRFLSTYPKSPYARVIRSLEASAGATTP